GFPGDDPQLRGRACARPASVVLEAETGRSAGGPPLGGRGRGADEYLRTATRTLVTAPPGLCSRWRPAHRDPARPPHLPGAPGHDRVIGELEERDTVEEGLQSHPELHAGEVGAEAAVDAGSEGEVAVAFAVDDELVGSFEHLGVAVAAREVHQHLVAPAHRAAR